MVCTVLDCLRFQLLAKHLKHEGPPFARVVIVILVDLAVMQLILDLNAMETCMWMLSVLLLAPLWAAVLVGFCRRPIQKF